MSELSDLRLQLMNEIGQLKKSLLKSIRTLSRNSGGTGTEVDPVFTAHVAYNITATQIAHWESAYGWGSHTGLYVFFRIFLVMLLVMQFHYQL
jgi:hypothetical protein